MKVVKMRGRRANLRLRASIESVPPKGDHPVLAKVSALGGLATQVASEE